MMHLNNAMNRFKNATPKMLQENSVNNIASAKPTVLSSQFDIDSINERLGKGDMTALKELEAQKIPYMLAENSNGYTVEYSYNGTKYIITFYSNEIASAETLKPVDDGGIKTDPVDDPRNKPSTKKDQFDDITPPAIDGPNTKDDEVPELPKTGEDEAPEPPKTDEFPFDYSNVDKDAKTEGFYNEDNVNPEKTRFFLNPKGDVDAGGWDDLFAELEKMKPQLLEYMKQQLEADGRVYDEDKAEKVINILITQAVNRIPKEGFLWAKSTLGASDPADEPLPENPTIEDLMNYMKNCLTITKDKGFHTQFVNTVGMGYQSDFEPKGDDNSFKIASYSYYYDADGYLLDTADYFLTDEEKEMKFVMQVTANEDTYRTTDKAKLLGYVDTYAKHMLEIIKHRHPTLTDEQCASIIADAKNTVKYLDGLKPDKNGYYSIDDVLARFEKLCLDYAVAYVIK